jgi:hypothetical protein
MLNSEIYFSDSESMVKSCQMYEKKVSKVCIWLKTRPQRLKYTSYGTYVFSNG